MHRYTRPRIDSVLAPGSSGPGQVQEDQHGGLEYATPLRQKTQEDQDKVDDKARQKALKDLIQSWQDRLNLITLITTFLASVEASMLQVTMPQDPSNSSGWSQASNAGFMASLVLHLFASFVSFSASFFLVRFKVQEAKREERQVEAADSSHQHTPTPPTPKASVLIDRAAHSITRSPKSTGFDDDRNETLTNEKRRLRSQTPPGIWSSDPRLVQIGPFQRQPPVNLLSRCHTLCLITTALGFIFAIVGVLCYSWENQATSVAIVTSVSIGLCLISSVMIVIPQNSGTKKSLFLYH
ncbi:hypothetical protein BDP27DRAFT_1337620 [Rhodocollybia butyracea]|uniref:Transmembrane protein n=1 Tax=Rhodocollybia butyracea TaxID=206335 RepID=A0A9P5U1Q1_9AGAR|nr:hypothetical protein BDP27DRAFT_1337620 [Rhodocollybia butyracea]